MGIQTESNKDKRKNELSQVTNQLRAFKKENLKKKNKKQKERAKDSWIEIIGNFFERKRRKLHASYKGSPLPQPFQ